MKVYKVELFIIDNDRLGSAEIKEVLEATKYPNYCIISEVKNIEYVFIENWSDVHPLNLYEKPDEAYEQLEFKPC